MGQRYEAEDTPGRVDVPHDYALGYKKALPWADADAIEIILSLFRAQRVMATAVGRQIDTLGFDYSLSGARFTLLRTLYFARDDSLAQNEISRRMGVSRTNVTNLIDGLERDGLVTRVANPADRRVSYARLTPEGERVCTTLLPVIARLMGDACQEFSGDEKQTFKNLLARLQNGVEDRFLLEGVTAAATPTS